MLIQKATPNVQLNTVIKMLDMSKQLIEAKDLQEKDPNIWLHVAKASTT